MRGGPGRRSGPIVQGSAAAGRQPEHHGSWVSALCKPRKAACHRRWMRSSASNLRMPPISRNGCRVSIQQPPLFQVVYVRLPIRHRNFHLSFPSIFTDTCFKAVAVRDKAQVRTTRCRYLEVVPLMSGAKIMARIFRSSVLNC